MSLVCSVLSNDGRSRAGIVVCIRITFVHLLFFEFHCVHFKWPFLLLLPSAIGVYTYFLLSLFCQQFSLSALLHSSLCQFGVHRLLPSEGIWNCSTVKPNCDSIFLLSAVSVVSHPLFIAFHFQSPSVCLPLFAFQFAFYIFALKRQIVLLLSFSHSFALLCVRMLPMSKSRTAAKSMTILI